MSDEGRKLIGQTSSAPFGLPSVSCRQHRIVQPFARHTVPMGSKTVLSRLCLKLSHPFASPKRGPFIFCSSTVNHALVWVDYTMMGKIQHVSASEICLFFGQLNIITTDNLIIHHGLVPCCKVWVSLKTFL